MKWYKRDPDAALAGMIGLTPEERGIYNTVLDLLYSRDGNVPNDDAFFSRACECRPQVWRRVRDSLLAKGKLHYKTDGKLTANRVESELLSASKLIANMARLGRVSAENRKHINDTTPTGPFNDTVGYNHNHIQKERKNLHQTARNGNSSVEAPLQFELVGGDQEKSHPSPRPLIGPEFDVWWNSCPRKIGKGAARAAYLRARKKTSAEVLLSGIKKYAEECRGKDPQYIAHPATWLNGERWLDQSHLVANQSRDWREALR